MINVVKCKLEECEKEAVYGRRGWCRGHYERWLRHGDPRAGRQFTAQGTPEERFWVKVDKRGPDECWEWLAGRNSDGYGTFAIRRSDRPDRFMPITAHRFSWNLHGGDLPLVAEHGRNDRTIDHTCKNRLCVNPAHMEVVTHEENARRAAQVRASVSEQMAMVAVAITQSRMGRATTQGIADELGVSKRAAKIGLDKIRAQGFVRLVHNGKWSYWEFAEVAA